MADNLKDIYDDQSILAIGRQFKGFKGDFDIDKFFKLVKQDDFESLELKQRFTRLATSLYAVLNMPYKDVCELLVKVNNQCVGFKYLFLPEIISIYGLDDLGVSLDTLEVLTTGSSGEFAIRDLLNKDYEKTFARIKIWATSDNEHVRRLASEGIRTKLPWGKKVKELYNHPLEIIDVLQLLKDDSSLYVRKSVANNLNDLSKDYPFLVFKVFKLWLNHSENTDWIIYKGARTMLKNGDEYVLNLLGYKDGLEVKQVKLYGDKKEYSINEKAAFNYFLKLESKDETKVRLSLLFEFKNKTGYGKKVFILKDVAFKGKLTINDSKSYIFKDYTVRKQYIGNHYVSLQVNGKNYKRIKILIK